VRQSRYWSKYVTTPVFGEMDSMTLAATSRSLMLRELDAFIRIDMAALWLHRFCAMTAPTAKDYSQRHGSTLEKRTPKPETDHNEY
jgi:hypothetical protein